MARIEGGAVLIDTDWPGLKNQIDTRSINFKYEEDATAYQIFAIDGQYFYQTIIYKSGQAPENQGTYDTWRAEFEASYKNIITDFTSTHPFYISNEDGYSVVLKDGATPTANDGYGIALIGYDGSNYRMTRMDSTGHQILVGAGIAGTPSGGVISIQGVSGGQAMPVSGLVTVSGTVTATNPSVGTNDAAIPSSSTLVGGSDGTNLRSVRIFDLDTGGGQQWVLGVGLRKASGGGSVELGTSTDPIRIDPTGTTTQPVSGTVTANQGGAWTVAATQSGTWTVQPGNTANTTPWLTTISQGGNAATVSASNALKVDGSAVTQPVSGTVTANAGTGNFTVVQATASNLRAQLASESTTGVAIPSTAVMVGGSDGTNLRSIFLDSSGRQIIIGAAANGVAVAGNPVLIAGSDGTNARSMRTATDGTIRVDPTGTTTQPISGTVTANIGTSGSLALDTSVNGILRAQGSTTSGQTGPLILGAVTTAAPSYTTGQSNPLSLDTTGALRITGSISASNQSVSIVNTTPPGSATYIGGSVTTAAPTYTTGQMSPLSLDTAGALRITGSISASNPSVGTNNAAIPTSSTQVGGSDGTNLRPFLTDSSGRQIVIGAAANGAAVTSNPVLMAGSDGTNARSIAVDTTGKQIIVPSNVVSTTNSTTSTLGIGGIFTGTFEEVKDYATISILMRTDQASATDGLEIQWSTDATNIDDTDTYTIPANNGKYFTFGPEGRYLRIRYTNGGVAQTAFRMQIIYHYFSAKPSSHRLTDTFNDENDAELVKAVIASKAPTGSFINVNSGAEGSLLVVQGPNLNSIHSNATITSSSNSILTTSFYGSQQVSLIINIKNTPTGTTPTLTYTIIEVDPGDQLTVLTSGNSSSTGTITAIGTYIATITYSTSSCFRVSWTITGTSASFTGVYATVVSKSTPEVGSTSTKGIVWGEIVLNSNAFSKIESTTYTEPTTGVTRSMSSSSGVDTAGNIGARTVRITYYDVTGHGPFTTTVTLNGTTTVSTSVSNICFVEKMEVATVGSSGVNAGTITLFGATGGGGGTIGTIASGTNTTRWAHHYVAIGKICYITSISCALNGSQGGTFSVRGQTLPLTVLAPDLQITESMRPIQGRAGGGTIIRKYDTPIKITGPARIRAYIAPDQSITATYFASIDYYDQ